MKPIAIFQHTEVGAPGNIIPIMEALGRRCEIIPIVDGAPVPDSPEAYGGLIFMGGYMGVHDPYPWIAQELSLIRQADALDIPVAGHCLGSQLLAVALGGEVRPNMRREIGWQRITVEAEARAQEWCVNRTPRPCSLFNGTAILLNCLPARCVSRPAHIAGTRRSSRATCISVCSRTSK